MPHGARERQGVHFEILFNAEDSMVRLVWCRDAAGAQENAIELSATDAFRIARQLAAKATDAEGPFSFRIGAMPDVTMGAPDAVRFFRKLMRAAQVAMGGVN